MKEILYILLILFAGFTIYSQFIKPNPPPTTIEIIDTLYVYQEPETLVVTDVYTRLDTIYTLDSNSIKTWQDSLKNARNFYENLINEYENGRIFTMYDTTVFITKDSLITTVRWYPFNDIRYLFYPAPEKILIAIPPGYQKKPWASITPYAELYFSNQLEFELGILFFTKNNFMIGIGENFKSSNNSLGISIGKKFDLNKPSLKFLF